MVIGTGMSGFEGALENAEDEELSEEGALFLAGAEGEDRRRMLELADELRASQAGAEATWVFNRNINFTDVCTNRCSFCSFRRDPGYTLSVDEVVDAAREAVSMGATEVTVQGGLNPALSADYYLEMVERLSDLGLHVHAFSPQEVHSISGGEFDGLLDELKEAGLSSMPGTAAEILVDEVRSVICPSKIDTEGWREVVAAAHGKGIPTSSTMMYGHVESWSDRVKHMSLLREVQRETGGFTEFVPLRFVPGANELGRVVDGEPDDLKLIALARLFLGPEIENVQASWVKLGPERASKALRCGANDVGGTLIEERISKRAGATEGEMKSPEELEELIRVAGLEPRQRDTLYGRV